ncbi:MAG TPA: DUF2442 domain-containing protein [Verrucomicrobiae bacterium]|jgi:hypothetical protein
MYLRVEKARYVPRYKVGIEFNDGARRVVNFEPFLKKAQNPMFTKYRLLKNFKSFHIDHGDLMWGDFEMIFPIMDLYLDTILKGEETGSSHFVLNETTAPVTSVPARRNKPVSYKSRRKS